MSIYTSSPWPKTSRNILNRLSFLTALRSRSRNLTEFHIRPDEPHRKYSPGDTVKGTVVLTVFKPIRITHLTVCLHGFVRVFKSRNCANEPFVSPGVSTSEKSRKSPYSGNRHASLFQDEVTLCGEGRLDAGIYEFNFELVFPSKGLPTSIDFERGTISYLITATITRPTSINATNSCDRKISLVEKVDIGPMLPPKPRTISLTPITRRTKRRRVSHRGKENVKIDQMKVESETLVPSGARPNEWGSSYGSVDHQIYHQITHGNLNLAESQSTTSTENSAISTEVSSREGSFRASAPGSIKSNSNHDASKLCDKDQIITAKIELLKSGCLPGDNIPVKIYIKHRKAIRSMHGVIITLYRQGRIDSAPYQSFPTHRSRKEAAKLKHEEYYPKSKTGLGGLSLTSAGSSSLFRKDLAQTFAPIVVDPNTLTAIINASVRVPEHVFPTIHGVPGQIVTFKYNIEICLDLGGKLASQQRYVPLLGTVTLPSSSNCINKIGHHDHSSSMFTVWGGSIVGTEAIRREKSVVACAFEITVGSEDSSRNLRWKTENSSRELGDDRTEGSMQNPQVLGGIPACEDSCVIFEQEGADSRQPGRSYTRTSNDRLSQNLEFYSYDGEHDTQSFQDSCLPPLHCSLPVPPPDILTDDNLNDKERVKRAEERLLPSCPPVDSSLLSSVDLSPKVPSNSTEINASLPTINDLHFLERSSLPDFTGNCLSVQFSDKDDKQELEYQRLMTEVSAPPSSLSPEIVDEVTESGNSSIQPVAPVFDDQDEYMNPYLHTDSSSCVKFDISESPPKYEK